MADARDATPGPGPGADRPRVGVVVAVRDGEAYLGAALDSVLAQTYQGWRCVVVDDASVDGTPDVIRAYEHDTRVRSVRHTGAGPGAARNRGLQELPPSVELLAFLDGDDTWLPDALERLVVALDREPGAVGVYGLAEYMDADGVPSRPGEHPARQRDRRQVRGLDLVTVPADRPWLPFSELVVVGPIWPSAVVLVRRRVVEQVGGYDESFRFSEDWDLYLRCSRHGDFLFLAHQVAWYRQHATNITRDELSAAQHFELVRHRARTSPENDLRQWWTAERSWRALRHRRLLRAAVEVVRAVRSRDRCRAAASAAEALGEAMELVRVRTPRRPGSAPAPRPGARARRRPRPRAVPPVRGSAVPRTADPAPDDARRRPPQP